MQCSLNMTVYNNLYLILNRCGSKWCRKSIVCMHKGISFWCFSVLCIHQNLGYLYTLSETSKFISSFYNIIPKEKSRLTQSINAYIGLLFYSTYFHNMQLPAARWHVEIIFINFPQILIKNNVSNIKISKEPENLSLLVVTSEMSR